MIQISQDTPLGTIVHKTSNYKWGIGRGHRMGISEKIQRVLRDGCHDAIVVMENGVKKIGDMSPPRAHTTPFGTYEDGINRGDFRIEFYWPAKATREQGERAAAWWMQNVNKVKKYDWLSFPLLYLKSFIDPTMDLFHIDWDVRWADWCTESVMHAWAIGCGVDPYLGNRNPTPATTQKRFIQGVLERTTLECLTHVRRTNKEGDPREDVVLADGFLGAVRDSGC